ncbi:peptidylprolyl isomerase [Sphingomonas sp. TX0543]|uniref:peptidylprolyl isomerase n=1 Tax=unclassified Sphingomonas TaxID=196159 RepID=UPI0010FA4B4C|nr:peptidylprolyl isomerase [Sphingomonas sp. 3P27F8]
MIAEILALLAMPAAPANATSNAAAPGLAPAEVVSRASPSEWRAIPASDIMVVELAPAAGGVRRRVVVQLLPSPISQGWIGNIRQLAKAHWWDGTSVNRVQDNYVAQWGDSTEKKPLPPGLATMSDKDYTAAIGETYLDGAMVRQAHSRDFVGRVAESGRDAYAPLTFTWRSWPMAAERRGAPGSAALTVAWPVHCYGMVGVGRNIAPDTGNGAELYAVIGHAPRHLDRNIALVGRVIEGIEHLSSLPRGTEALGMYATAAERVPIISARIARDLPPPDQPHFEYLATDSDSFARYADARANRHDAFFIRPAGGADICNVPTPIRRAN